ncbi:MAG: hypothetical protein GXP16_08335 [Gammaproteobacteria bacterium]|nr:hypothetical protein [Gammaproteobacteria bacterium]
MPLKSAYDDENFEPGWSRIPQYKNAQDPRDVSCWLLDPWPVFPPKEQVVQPTPERDVQLVEYLNIAGRLRLRSQKILRGQVDDRLSHMLALDAPSPDLRLCWILARAYEAADCFSAHLVHERKLISESKFLSEELMESAIWHPEEGEPKPELSKKVIERSIGLLRELTFPNAVVDLENLSANLEECVDTRLAISTRLSDIYESGTILGRKPDRAFQFFILRLLEAFVISTGDSVSHSFKPALNRNGEVTTLWQLFLTRAVNAVGLPIGENHIDHALRLNRKREGNFHLLSQLQDIDQLVKNMRPPQLDFGWIPSIGDQIELNCVAFYKVGRYPPLRS